MLQGLACLGNAGPVWWHPRLTAPLSVPSLKEEGCPACGGRAACRPTSQPRVMPVTQRLPA
jgi:hypothetical protein